MEEQMKRWGEISAPCKGCKDRFVVKDGDKITRCHATCERYKAFYEANEAHRAQRKAFVKQNDACMDVYQGRRKRK